MRWLALLLLASSASAQVIAPGRIPDGAGMVSPPRPAFELVAPPAGDYLTLRASGGQTISCTRSSASTVQTSAGALATVASSHCAVDYRGVQAENASKNWVARNSGTGLCAYRNSTASWYGTCSDNTGTDPLGGSASMQFTVPSAGEGYYNLAIGTALANRTFTLSEWCRTTGGTAQFYLGMTDASAWAAGEAAQSSALTATTTWARYSLTITYGAGVTSTNIGAVGPGQLGHLGNPNLTGGATLQCWGQQLEELDVPSSTIITTGTAVTRAEDAISVSGTVAAKNAISMRARATIYRINTAQTNYIAQAYGSGSDRWDLYVTSTGKHRCEYFSPSSDADSSGTVATGVAQKINCAFDGTRGISCIQGACTSTALSPVTASTNYTIYLTDHACIGCSGMLSGWLAYLCLDGYPSRCMP